MNKEVKEKWVEALRSGKYKQTTGSLKDKTGYCCLGVLCSITKSKNWVGSDDEELPPHVADKVGLAERDPTVRYNGRSTLIRLNDTELLTFDQIADIIEKQL